MKNDRDGTLQLFKSSLAVQRSRDYAWETYSVQEVISAQLLGSIEEQATYKFLTHGGSIEDAKDAMLVSKD